MTLSVLIVLIAAGVLGAATANITGERLLAGTLQGAAGTGWLAWRVVRGITLHSVVLAVAALTGTGRLLLAAGRAALPWAAAAGIVAATWQLA